MPILAFAVSVPLAFRMDYISVDAYHPAYFIEVIQGLKYNLKLFYSQPSQYGFLNIFLPSILPMDGLGSFHVFQGGLLVAATVLTMLSLYCLCKSTSLILFICLAPFAVMLADLDLIGPNAFPSSSVMRFFPVYLFLTLIALNFNARSREIIWLFLLNLFANAYNICVSISTANVPNS